MDGAFTTVDALASSGPYDRSPRHARATGIIRATQAGLRGRASPIRQDICSAWWRRYRPPRRGHLFGYALVAAAEALLHAELAPILDILRWDENRPAPARRTKIDFRSTKAARLGGGLM